MSSEEKQKYRQDIQELAGRRREAKARYLEEKSQLQAEKAALRQHFRQQKEEALPPRPVDPKQAARREARRLRNEPPRRSVLEEVGSSVTHGVGALLSAAALILMLLHSHTPLQTLAACVYGGCLFLLFLMSCLYHAFPAGTTVKRLWRRFDYSSIYLLIGGTFTPILLLYVGGTLGTALCIAQWAIIIAGITFIGVFGPGTLKALHFSLYFVIGWSAIVFLPRMFNEARLLFWLILLGGVVYTLGTIPFARKSKGAHFVWHFFVLAGAFLQWLGIWLHLYP